LISIGRLNPQGGTRSYYSNFNCRTGQSLCEPCPSRSGWIPRQSNA
jgi:hypothetical protein